MLTTLYLSSTQKGKVTALSICVDDMVVSKDDLEEKKAIQKYLAGEFEMKGLGQLKYIFGIEVARSKQGIYLSQRKYMLDLLTETVMLACKLIETPIDMNRSQAGDNSPSL